MNRLFEYGVLNVINFLLIILSLFAARYLGGILEIPYAMHYACAAWGVYSLVQIWNDADSFVAFDHSRPPAEMIAHGCAGLIFIALLTWQPFAYPKLADMPWPLQGSLFGFVIPNTPGHVYLVEWISLFGLVLVPLLYAIMEIGGAIAALGLLALGRLDADHFEPSKYSDAPSYYELTQTIHALEKALSNAEGAREAADAEALRLRRERDAQAREEQAIRQELVRSATQLSVLQKENTQLQLDLRSEQETVAEMRTSLLDLETVVQDLRARLHAQNAKQPKRTHSSTRKAAAGALSSIIDPGPKPS